MSREPRLPHIGARFRRMRVQPLSGEKLGYAMYEVVGIKPPAFISPFGRVEFKGENGRLCYVDVEHLWGTAWEAIENVVALPHPTTHEALKAVDAHGAGRR